jgi:hypothetical protein
LINFPTSEARPQLTPVIIIAVLVPPSPVFPLLAPVCFVPFMILPASLLQVTPVGAFLALVPLMIILVVSIIVPPRLVGLRRCGC